MATAKMKGLGKRKFSEEAEDQDADDAEEPADEATEQPQSER